MKKIHILLSLAILLLLWSACKQNCPDPGNQVNYVDKTYLPDIIPYSDTSTARFLKNGKDTLLFKSQGLKETFVGGSTLDSDCPKNFSNQQLSLTMKASDTDYFEIRYFAISSGVPRVMVRINNRIETENYTFSAFRKPYPPILKVKILNQDYDTVIKLPEVLIDEIYLKPKLGLLKVKTSKVLYELIK